MQDYIKHLQSKVKYWQRIALAEREKNIKLEEIIKKIEEKIYNLEDKEGNNMKCTIRNKGCVGYGGNGQCISIENCKYQDRFSKSSNKKCSKEDK